MNKRKRPSLLLAALLCCVAGLHAQKPDSTALTMDEYVKARDFIIRDLDNETYVKFDGNKYVAERYEDRKPYYITGDDGMKKRVDLYSLTRKGQPGVIGTLIYYTTEKGKLYSAVLPGRSAAALVWERYFEDIHAIDKTEPFFVLKLSYVLSKEFSYQQYKSSLKGRLPDRSEAATYGNDICFPGDDWVEMADGVRKKVSDMRRGDAVFVVDPETGMRKKSFIGKVVVHEAKNYAITKLLMLKATQGKTSHEWTISIRELEATPNHPMVTRTGQIKVGDIVPGAQLLCKDKASRKYVYYTVWDKEEYAKGIEPVYSLELSTPDLMIINGVTVRQK